MLNIVRTDGMYSKNKWTGEGGTEKINGLVIQGHSVNSLVIVGQRG